MTTPLDKPMTRRQVLNTVAATALTIDPALRAAVYAQGSDKPEKKKSGSASFPSPIAPALSWRRCWASTRNTA